MNRAFSARRVKRQALFLLAFFAILVIALAVHLASPIGQIMSEAEAALESDQLVRVERGPWLAFMPKAEDVSSGLIFYPGGRVAPEAYAPLARSLAEAGSLAVITPMPLNLAILNWQAASAVIEAHPQVSAWVMAGHSLGGAMAARYAHANLDKIAGLALLAAYPEAELDFRGTNLALATIYGDQDGLASLGEVEGSFAKLPQDARKILIPGANHAQFGWYGEQAGDKPAQISRQAQHEHTTAAILALLHEAGK